VAGRLGRAGERTSDSGSSPGARAEPRGGAGPVGGLLGGKDPTGRFLVCPLSAVRSPLSVANELLLQTMDYRLALLTYADQVQVVHKPIGEHTSVRIS
jgi:hypothetical protein